ncbi:MAG: hypothetical protein WBL96_04630, partial [Pseudolabrys sp.]
DSHVRFPPKADMCSAQADVRFVPEAAHCKKRRTKRIHTLPSGGSLTLLFAPIFLADLRVADELATLTVAGVRLHRPLNCSGGGCCNKSGHRQGRK